MRFLRLRPYQDVNRNKSLSYKHVVRHKRKMINKLNIQEININLSSERPCAIATKRYHQ